MDTGKFSKAKVYKITDVNYTKCYIGSTCEELSQRMARHRYMYNQHINRGKESHRTANVLFDEFGIHNCKIELLEEYSCNNLMELHRREGYYIQNNNCVNKRVEGQMKNIANKMMQKKKKDTKYTMKITKIKGKNTMTRTRITYPNGKRTIVKKIWNDFKRGRVKNIHVVAVQF